MDEFQFYRTSIPPKLSYVYFKDMSKLVIYYTGIESDPKRYIPFICFECSFFGEDINFLSETLEWKKLSDKFVMPCNICNQLKIYHFCGKDSHPFCFNSSNEVIRLEKEKIEKIHLVSFTILFWLIIFFLSGKIFRIF
jgi:hypothetical protein